MRKELLITLFKQSKWISFIIAINIYIYIYILCVCFVIVHCSGEDLVQLDLGMTIKSENS